MNDEDAIFFRVLIDEIRLVFAIEFVGDAALRSLMESQESDFAVVPNAGRHNVVGIGRGTVIIIGVEIGIGGGNFAVTQHFFLITRFLVLHCLRVVVTHPHRINCP